VNDDNETFENADIFSRFDVLQKWFFAVLIIFLFSI
jgi:hypothetical protein